MNIRNWYILALGVAVAGILWAVPAPEAGADSSGMGCEQRETLVGLLEHSYDEVPIAAGLEETGNVIEVLASRDGKSFTVLITRPDGVTCVAASGQHWLMLDPEDKTGSRS